MMLTKQNFYGREGDIDTERRRSSPVLTKCQDVRVLNSVKKLVRNISEPSLSSKTVKKKQAPEKCPGILYRKTSEVKSSSMPFFFPFSKY